MEKLYVLLKNSKEIVSTEVPYIQALHWRNALMQNQTIWLVTKERGTMKVDGRAVETTKLHRDSWRTEEVAAAMLMFPCMVYECEKGLFQFSNVSNSYEQGDKRNGYWRWSPAALPQSIDWRPGNLF